MKIATNRRVIIPIIFGVVLIAAGIVVMKIKKPVQKYRSEFFSMDCLCTVTVYSDKDTSKDIRKRIEDLDSKLSAYEEGSEINRLNESGKAELSDESAELIKKCCELYKKYGGCDVTIGAVTKLWDITGEPRVPDDEEIEMALGSVDINNIVLDGKSCTLKNGAQLDLGCIAKGYAVDKIKELLDKQKTKAAVISFGSSILCYGEKPDGESFNIGIRDPLSSGLCAEVETEECFVSTSGGYERFFEADGRKYCHIFDEKTGRPTESDLLSVTVIGDSGCETDFLSTRIFLDGEDGLDKWLKLDSFKVIAVCEDGRIRCSEEIKQKITVKADGYEIV